MIMVSFCWKRNFPYNKIKNQFRFIDDVLEINDQSRCILSGPPCIYMELTYISGFVIISKIMWQCKEYVPHQEDEGPSSKDSRFVAFFSKVRNEEEDDEDGEIVRTRDEAALCTREMEASFQRRSGDVNESVDRHTLTDGKQADKE